MSAKRSSSVSKEQASRLISATREKARSDQRKVDETPPPSEWKREFGDKCKLSDDGRSFELTLREDRDIKRAIEMQDGARNEEIRRGAEVQSRMAREKIARRDGRIVDFPEDLIDTVKHKVRPVGRGGIAPAEHFSLSKAFGKYEQGPDGLWFVWNDGWEPTALWRNGALSPQRDPAGNRWVEHDGEWYLEDEVA